MPLEFLLMTENDIPAVMAIEQMAYSSPWAESVYRQELKNDLVRFFVVKHEAQILGYSGIWQMGDAIHIGTLVSHPQVRRQGIGELLLMNTITQAYALQATEITLEVRPSNQAARNLYTKYGFIDVGRRKRYYPDTGEDAIIMTTPKIVSSSYRALLRRLVKDLENRLGRLNLDELAELT